MTPHASPTPQNPHATSGNAPRVLVMEDDDVVRQTTALALQRYGFDVEAASDGLSGMVAFERQPPDLALVDVMMPFVDGIEVCRRIRAMSDVPVVLLTARTESTDIVQGLEAGADDYVTKPFDPMVLVARLRAVLRRVQPPADDHHVSTVGVLTLDHDSLEVSVEGRRVQLTPTELKLLLELVRNAGIVVTRERLLNDVWDYPADGDTRVVDVHVQRLRAKITPARIETVRGFGFKLVP